MRKTNRLTSAVLWTVNASRFYEMPQSGSQVPNNDVFGNDGSRGESCCGWEHNSSRSDCRSGTYHGRNHRHNRRRRLPRRRSFHYVRAGSLTVIRCSRRFPYRYGYSFCGMRLSEHGHSLQKNCSSLLYARGNRLFRPDIRLCAPNDVRTDL